MAPARYKVSVCIAPGIPGFEGAPASIDHVFTSKSNALAFARAVSRYFVTPDPAIRQSHRTFGDPAPGDCVDSSEDESAQEAA